MNVHSGGDISTLPQNIPGSQDEFEYPVLWEKMRRGDGDIEDCIPKMKV